MKQLIWILLDVFAICALTILIVSKFTIINDVVVYFAYVILLIYIIITIIKNFQRL